MCSTGHPEPETPHSAQILWANLMQPGPLGWKLQRFFANTFTKISRGQQCCGNDGEPGC
jgi:hypothetical protein